MTRDVVFVTPAQTMDTAANHFETRDLHHLPVVDNNRVVGVSRQMKVDHWGIPVFGLHT